MPTKRQQYTREYKIEAIRLSRDGSRSVAETASALGITANQLHRWRREFGDDGVAAFAGNGVVKAHDEELHRLRRENKRLTEERDFLKKATAFFAKESR
jgi:transposase